MGGMSLVRNCYEVAAACYEYCASISAPRPPTTDPVGPSATAFQILRLGTFRDQPACVPVVMAVK